MRMFTPIDSNKMTDIFTHLLPWYELHKRDLPWRSNPDFYSIWISEIMAQQTRMATLVPYYLRFKNLFPTIEDLSKATIIEVRKAWEGLGYYQRANNLHKTAQIIVATGKLPTTEKELLALPGIGPYTAGAILSMVYNQPYPAVDGNLLRIFARIENNFSDVTKEPVRKSLTKSLKPHYNEKAATMNQSLMELGALICLPQTPNCSLCPIQRVCLAYKHDTMDELPNRGKAIEKKMLNKTILIIENENKEVLMRQRKEKLLEGFWDFYQVDNWINEKEIVRILTPNFDIEDINEIGQDKHIFTHMVWQMQGFHVFVKNSSPLEDFSFLPLSHFTKIPIPSAIKYYTKYLLSL